MSANGWLKKQASSHLVESPLSAARHSLECLRNSEYHLSSSLSSQNLSRSEDQSTIDRALLENQELRFALTNAEQGWKGALAVAQTLQRQLGECEVQLQQTDHEIKKCRGAEALLVAQKIRAQEVERELETLKATHQRTQTLLQETNGQVTAALAAREQLEKEKKDLEAQVRQQLGNSTTKRQLELANEEAMAFKVEIERLHKQLNERDNQTSGAQLELDVLQRDLKARNQRIENYERTFSDVVAYLDRENEKLTKALLSLDQAFKALQSGARDQGKAGRESLQRGHELTGPDSSASLSCLISPHWVERPVRKVGELAAFAAGVAAALDQWARHRPKRALGWSSESFGDFGARSPLQTLKIQYPVTNSCDLSPTGHSAAFEDQKDLENLEDEDEPVPMELRRSSSHSVARSPIQSPEVQTQYHKPAEKAFLPLSSPQRQSFNSNRRKSAGDAQLHLSSVLPIRRPWEHSLESNENKGALNRHLDDDGGFEVDSLISNALSHVSLESFPELKAVSAHTPKEFLLQKNTMLESFPDDTLKEYTANIIKQTAAEVLKTLQPNANDHDEPHQFSRDNSEGVHFKKKSNGENLIGSRGSLSKGHPLWHSKSTDPGMPSSEKYTKNKLSHEPGSRSPYDYSWEGNASETYRGSKKKMFSQSRSNQKSNTLVAMNSSGQRFRDKRLSPHNRSQRSYSYGQQQNGYLNESNSQRKYEREMSQSHSSLNETDLMSEETYRDSVSSHTQGTRSPLSDPQDAYMDRKSLHKKHSSFGHSLASNHSIYHRKSSDKSKPGRGEDEGAGHRSSLSLAHSKRQEELLSETDGGSPKEEQTERSQSAWRTGSPSTNNKGTKLKTPKRIITRPTRRTKGSLRYPKERKKGNFVLRARRKYGLTENSLSTLGVAHSKEEGALCSRHCPC